MSTGGGRGAYGIVWHGEIFRIHEKAFRDFGREGLFRAPARVTFGRCPKSDQKDSLNLRFKNPPAL